MFSHHDAALNIDSHILRATHYELGYSGTTQAYMLVCRLYHWEGLKATLTSVLNSVRHVKRETYK